MSSDTRPLIIACGALATELRAVLRASGVEDRIEVKYLPANLHNRPENITPQVADLLEQNSARATFVAYADCGTGGHLDLLLEKYPAVSRLPGAHCYEFFAGTADFLNAHDEEPGTFYLTDFLAKHFDALVWQGLGLEDHPELLKPWRAGSDGEGQTHPFRAEIQISLHSRRTRLVPGYGCFLARELRQRDMVV